MRNAPSVQQTQRLTNRIADLTQYVSPRAPRGPRGNGFGPLEWSRAALSLRMRPTWGKSGMAPGMEYANRLCRHEPGNVPGKALARYLPRKGAIGARR